VLQFFDVIQTSIPHIYHSALPSLPTNSQLFQQHESELAAEVRVIGGIGSSWDACIRTIQVPGDAVCVAFSPNGKTIASGIRDMVQIFDAITGVSEITLESPYDVTSLIFSPDGSLLASSAEDSIMLWDIQTGGLVRKLEGYTDFVRTLAFSPCGTTLVSCGEDSDIRIWNPLSGNCDAIIKGHTSPIDSLCWLSDTVVASGSDDGLVKLWDIPARRWLKDLSHHTDRVHSVSCSADGSKLASASWDRTLKVYDVPTGATLKTIPIRTSFVSLSSKGDRLVCRSAADLQIWDLSRDVPLTISAAHGNHEVNSACFSPDATFIASAGGHTVKLWATEFHDSRDFHSKKVGCICFSEDGSLIASGSFDGTVKIWDAKDCSCLLTLSCGTDESRSSITTVAFSPNRTLVGAGSFDGAVWIWDVESQKSRAMMDVRRYYGFKHTKFSPDGCKFVSVSLDSFSSGDSIQVWDAQTGSLLAFNGMDQSIKWITFSDGDEIVAQVDGKLERLKLCPVSTSSPTLSPSEEIAGTSTPFDLVLSTDDKPTVQPQSPSYRLLQELGWDHQWIVDSQERRVFHWFDANVSACHMTKFAVGTTIGRVAILDFSNVTY
jgi:WD40 repeat protein